MTIEIPLDWWTALYAYLGVAAAYTLYWTAASSDLIPVPAGLAFFGVTSVFWPPAVAYQWYHLAFKGPWTETPWVDPPGRRR
jgi:hypothetical protein